MIALVLAAALHSSEPAIGCHPIDRKELFQRVAEVRAAGPDDLNAQGDKITALAEYWGDTCLKDRVNLSKDDVLEISSLLKITYTQNLVSSILAYVGKNLRYASGDISAALEEAQARDKAYMEASPIWLGPPSATYALRCLQGKIRTGARNKRLCWTLQSIEPAPKDDHPGGPVTFEAKEIKLD